MPTAPFMLRGLLACTAVATLLIGGSAAATAQSDEEETGVLVVSAVPIGTVELAPPIVGDLTGEGSLVGVPSGPVVIEPAPVANPPQTEVVVPVGSAGPVPEHASISHGIFNDLCSLPEVWGCDPLP